MNICFFFSIALEAKTTIHKSAKGPISIAECDNQGRFIVVENTSRSKSIALAAWKLRQEMEHGETLIFTFPENALLRPNQSLKVEFVKDFSFKINVESFEYLRFLQKIPNQNEEVEIWSRHRCLLGIQVPMSLLHCSMPTAR